jgi:hypothetical protein
VTYAREFYTHQFFSSDDQATFVASEGWPHWCIFGGNCSHLLQK